MEGKNTVNTIYFISWNIKGPNESTKMNTIMSHIQGQGGDMVFLQETHLCNDEILHIKSGRFCHLYYLKFSARARGLLY